VLIVVPFVCVMLASTGTAGASLTTGWSQTTSLPATDWNMGTAVSGGEIYVAGGGGTNGVNPVKTVEVFNPTTKVWTAKATLPTARGGLVLVPGTGGLLFAIGGHTATDSATSLNTAYNPATNTWTAKAPLPQDRTDMGATTGGPYHRIFTVGGYNPFTGQADAAMFRYSQSTNTWTDMKSLPAARSYPAVASSGGNVYVFGGGVNASPFITNFVGTKSAFEYDVSTNSWKTLAPMPVAELGAAAVTGADGLIYVIGGTQQSVIGWCNQTIQIYNPKTNTWSQSALPNTDPQGGLGATGVFEEGAVAIGTQLYFVGGQWLEPDGSGGLAEGFLNTVFTATTS